MQLKDVYAFVKDTGRDKYWKTQENELAKLIDPATGLIDQRYTQPVPCVVCGSDRYNVSFVKEGFQFVKCCECNLLYVNPQLSEQHVLEDYKDKQSLNEWVDVLLSEKQQQYDRQKKYRPALEVLSKQYPQKGKILDVGCSIGLFLDEARSLGWQPYGLEINRKALRYARETLGLEVHDKLIHETPFKPETFQIISLWGVLEHLSHPRDVLGHCHELLAPGGTLLIFVPNGHSLVTRIMHAKSPTFGGRNHLWYFTPQTLGRLLSEEGFEPGHTYTQLPQIEELLHFLRYNDPYLPGLPVQKEEFQLSSETLNQLQKFILDNHLGYKLVMFARKKATL
jgi:2-polyprenyl-3-methyl-5-hydroxy-6-metoxy-1,4-benzoquinol methylase